MNTQFLESLLEKWTLAVNNARTRWRWLGYLLSVGAFAYLAALLIYSGVQAQELELDWRSYSLASLLALLLYLVSLIFQYAVWARLVSFHHQVTWQDVAIYARTLLLRRLPGGVWHWVGRAALYRGSTELPARIVLLGNFLEWVLLLLCAGAIIALGAGWGWLGVGGAVLLAGFALVLAYSWQPKQRSPILRLGEALIWLLLYSLAWAAGGIIVAALARAAGTESLGWLQAIWVWALTGGFGLLLIIVPAGLGIREFTLTVALQPYLPTASALILAVLLRLIFTLADLLWGFLGVMVSTAFVRKNKKPDLPGSSANLP